VIDSVGPLDLTPVVRAALGDPTAEPLGWSVEPIGYANMRPATHGAFRVAGTARARRGTEAWSVVLKTVRRPAWAGAPVPPACPPHGDCWHREVLAYRAGLLDDLPGVRAPRCYAVADQPDGGFWLWLEELVDTRGGAWTVERYGLAARHFGRLGGAYLTGRPLPAHPWLSRARLGPAGALTGSPGWALGLAKRAATWEHPLVRRAYPPGVAERVRRVAAAHDHLYARLQGPPRVLCHWDAFRSNLISVRGADGGEETAAIDWSCMGHGAVGEELVPLVVVTLLWFDLPAEHARALADACLAGYLQGLADAGWRGEPGPVRSAFVASLARWLPLAAGLHILTGDDPTAYVARLWRRGLDEALSQWSVGATALLPLAEEAVAAGS
jgi:hypothetical protein